MGKRVGVIGGSFDPVHVGHLLLAEQIRIEAVLSEIIFVPASVSPFKTEHAPVSGEHRLNMLKLAVSDNPRFIVSDIEIDREGPSYTYTTLKEIKAGLQEDDELYFIIGIDAFLDIDKWYEADKLLSEFKFIVGYRQGYDEALIKAKIDELQRVYGTDVRYIKTPEAEISSSDIRERIISGKSIKYMVPDSVLSYIYNNNVYVNFNDALKEFARRREKPKRFKHTEGVVDSIKELAKRFNMDVYKAETCAWAHDTFKEYGISHGKYAAEALKSTFGIDDTDILEAVAWHTTGKPGMNDYTKLLKLADMIEPNRVYPEVERIRASVSDSLNESIHMLMVATRDYVHSIGANYLDISNEAIAYLEELIEREKNG